MNRRINTTLCFNRYYFPLSWTHRISTPTLAYSGYISLAGCSLAVRPEFRRYSTMGQCGLSGLLQNAHRVLTTDINFIDNISMLIVCYALPTG
jgi:hypothetical protein